MKSKFSTWHRGLLAGLFLLWAWSLWAQQTATNRTAGEVAAARAGLAKIARTFPLESDVTPAWVTRLTVDFPILQQVWLGNELWKYLASALYILLAFYFSKLLDYLTCVWLRRRAARTGAGADDLLLELLNGPVKLVVFVLLLQIGLGIIHWPDRVELLISRGLTILMAATLTYILLKLTDLFMGLWRRRMPASGQGAMDEQLYSVVRKSAKTFIVVVAVLATAQNLQINVTAAITSLSIGGLAVGLAAQDTLANLFGAVAVFMDRPFRVGDVIRLDTLEGVVESIGLRSLRVRNGRGHLVTIPNKAVGNATIVNISQRPLIQTELSLVLAAETPIAQLRQALGILREVYGGHHLTRDCIISFDKFQDNGLHLLVLHSTAVMTDKEHFALREELNLAAKARLDAIGIQLAQPARIAAGTPLK